MTRYKEVSLDERKLIQLNMLKEFDSFCRNNDLRYSLAYGTLLGAVRHKGYIPWDDDVDIIMPLPDVLKVKQLLKSQSIRYCDVDLDNNYEYSFSRIVYNASFQKIGVIAKEYGINIDLYIAVGISEKQMERNLYYRQADRIHSFRKRIRRFRSILLHSLPIRRIPFFNFVMRKFRDHMIFSKYTVPYDSASVFFSVSGYRDERGVLNFDLFEELIDLPFENLSLRVTSHYDQFLRNAYGNYMELPPIDARKPYHTHSYYLE